jgi:hypothetical protein
MLEDQQPELADSVSEWRIPPSQGSSEKDFDFLVGEWEVHNKKLKSRLTNCDEWSEFDFLVECRKILKGFGSIDSYRTLVDNVSFEAMALRLFNPETRLWTIYWANSNAVVLEAPVIGSFDREIGTFYGSDVWEGQRVIVRFRWDKTARDLPVWSQAFSPDDGKTWEWNWHMTFYKRN